MRQRLGQHFLKDQHVLENIAAVLDIDKNDVVIEIGPGHGELTQHLLAAQPKRLIIIEKDQELANQLKENLEGSGVEIVIGDALKALPDIVSGLNGKSYKVTGNIPYYITTGDTGASFVRADGFNGAGSNYYWSDPTIGFPDSYNYLGGFSFGLNSAVWYGNDGAGDQSEFMQSIYDGGTGAFDTVFNGSIAGNGSQLSIQPLGTNIIYGAPLSYLVDTSWTNTFADSQSNGQIANFLTSDNSQGNFYISNGLNQSATTGLLFGYGRGTPQNTDVYFQAVGNGNYYFFDNVGAFTNTVYMGNISAKGQFSVNLKVGTYMNVVGSMTVTGILGTSTTTISNNLSISSGAWITVSTNSGGGYMGTGTLSSGSATILTNKIHTGDYVFLTDTGNSITNLGSLEVQSITNGGSFLVKSSNVSDSSTFNWLILRASP